MATVQTQIRGLPWECKTCGQALSFSLSLRLSFPEKSLLGDWIFSAFIFAQDPTFDPFRKTNWHFHYATECLKLVCFLSRIDSPLAPLKTNSSNNQTTVWRESYLQYQRHEADWFRLGSDRMRLRLQSNKSAGFGKNYCESILWLKRQTAKLTEECRKTRLHLQCPPCTQTQLS